MRAKLFTFLVSIWLFGIIFPPTVDSENMALAQFGAFVWLPIVALLGSRSQLLGSLLRERPAILVLVVASILAIVASAVLSEEPSRSLAFAATAAIGLFALVGLWDVVGDRIQFCLATYAVLGTALICYAYYVGARVQGRLTIGAAHPNYLGIVSFGILMCAVTVRPWPLAAVLTLTNLFIIVDTQSRSALAAALGGLLLFAALKTNQIGRRKAALALAATSLICAMVLLVYQQAALDGISALFFLDDKNRGIGTGFTGRVGAWQEAIDLFSENPIFGVGFRMHERYMTILSSAHNGYVSLLAEVGIVGAVPLVALVLLLTLRLARRALQGDPMAIVGFSFVMGYLLIAAFERLFLNMGNPTSVVAWMFLLIANPKPHHRLLHPRRLTDVGWDHVPAVQQGLP
jgi:O-antigen ligase